MEHEQTLADDGDADNIERAAEEEGASPGGEDGQANAAGDGAAPEDAENTQNAEAAENVPENAPDDQGAVLNPEEE